MPNIYKYELSFQQLQTLLCRPVKVLDVQIQNGKPYIWVLTSADVPQQNVGIIMQPTGTDILAIVEDLAYISTTQNDGYVWHWFTTFGTKVQEKINE